MTFFSIRSCYPNVRITRKTTKLERDGPRTADQHNPQCFARLPVGAAAPANRCDSQTRIAAGKTITDCAVSHPVGVAAGLAEAAAAVEGVAPSRRKKQAGTVIGCKRDAETSQQEGSGN